MKKKFPAAALTAAVLTAAILSACGDNSGEASQQTADASSDSEVSDSETFAGMANPWTESDRQDVLDATGFEMDAPEDASDVSYSYMADENLAQLSYTVGNDEWTYRMQPADELTDISGMYYDWTAEYDGTVGGLDAKYMVYSDADENTEYLDDVFGVNVVNWYDPDAGVTYSLSVSGNDLNGMDFEMYAEQIYSPLQNN